MGDQSSRLADDMHPSTFIVEEMMARGWTSDHLAVAMAMHSKHDACICKMKIDMYLTVAPQDDRLRLGETALEIERAFGVSDGLFTRLEQAWLDDRAAAQAQKGGG